MLTYILFFVGFFLLIKGADILVDGATSIAKRLKISNIVIGLTVVAFGTSAPELFINIFASITGSTEIAISNILGSNIANILLILGLSSMIYPITAGKNTVMKEIPFSLLSAVLLGIIANDRLIDGAGHSEISRIDGLVFLSFLVIFIYYTYGISRETDDLPVPTGIKTLTATRSGLYIFAGIIGLASGGNFIVDGAVKIAEHFNVSQSFIGLTVVAIGTSLPELATSVVAAYKKQSDIAIGNVVGSNILNIFWILGLSAVIRPLPFDAGSNISILVAIFATIALFLAAFTSRKHTIKRWQGAIMFTSYIVYIAYLIIIKR